MFVSELHMQFTIVAVSIIDLDIVIALLKISRLAANLGMCDRNLVLSVTVRI